MARRSLFSGDNQGKRRSEVPRDEEVDMTPMIDCTFQLLIFFMVTSTMEVELKHDLPAAAQGTGLEARATTIVSVQDLNGTGNPVILLGDSDGEQGTIDQLKAYIEKGVRENKGHVIIKADRNIKHGFVQTVARTVTGVEGATFTIGVTDHKTEQ
jgi:biopolymer transport protein ExbD